MVEYNVIKKDGQITKFCFYGFFKNLKFFEPYLLVYLSTIGFSLFQIGLFYAIRSTITYIFEVPSAIIADHYGKKNELYMCFTFYIVSFVFFFLGQNFIIIAIGMMFFGLGEAFRSGTHKAMILSYLEHKGWYEHKGFVYGRTRSFSLIGSSVSAFLSIVFVLNLPALKWIFLLSIIPYVLDFILIATYPAYLNERFESKVGIKQLFSLGNKQIKAIFKDANIMKIVISSASYDGVFKTIKDYIQPILKVMLIGVGIKAISDYSQDESLKIILGVLYGIFYIFSAMASKNIYRATKKFGSERVFSRLYDILGLALVLLAFTVKNQWIGITIALYFSIYLLSDARRPTFLELSSQHMKKSQRVTVLSLESQLKAVAMMIFAPMFGWIADTFSLSVLFAGLGALILVGNRFFKLKVEA